MRGSRKFALEASEQEAPTTPPASRSYEESSSEKQRKANNARSAGLKQPRDMGMREMDQVSRLPRGRNLNPAGSDAILFGNSTSQRSISSTST
jgi:hypothetical protein